MQQISESELVLMKIIWKNGGTALYSHIMEELEKDRNEWKKNTVLTLLSRLVEKNFLRTDKIGRRNEYRAIVAEREYQTSQTKNFLDRVYEGNVNGLVSTLLQQDMLSEEELKEIEAFLETQKRRGALVATGGVKMEGFVKTLLSLSFSGTFLFLIVLLIVRLCRNRMSRRWQYYIWLLVVLRFLVPITVPNALTGNLFRDVERAVEERALATETVGDKNAANVTADASDNLSEKWERQNTAAYRMTANGAEQNAIADRRAPGIYFWLFGIWFAGAFGLLIRKIAAYQKYMHFLWNGNTEVSDLTVLNLLADVEEELKIRRTIELYRNPMISSPIMTGFLKPGIVIPDRKITEKELICVFTHELVHFKYLDMFYKWLVQITICIHWFNPFVRLLGKEVNKCCELACDEKVIGALDEQARKAYGDTLLAFLQRGGTYRNPLASITLTEGAEQIIERLGAIMDYQKKSGTVILLTTALTVLVGFFFSGIGAYAEEKAGGQETAGQKADDWKAGYYAYYQRSQYEEPYLIEYGWNLKEEYMTYYAREEIQLEDQSSVTVCFAEEAERWMKDAEAMEAVARLLGELKPIARRQYGFEFERPYIVRMIYLPPDEIGDFARRAFENDNIADFSAVVRLLSEDEKKEYCEKSYERDSAGFFSIIISEMGEDYVTEFAERCYEKDDITYFSIMEDCLSDEARKNLMERALQENREDYYYILEPEKYEEEWQERLARLEDMADELRELKDMEGRMNKIAVISDTHGLLRPEVLEILKGCDAILHGGDINRQKILDELNGIAPVFAVRGNNDKEWAEKLPETLDFMLYGIRFFMVHNKKQIPKDIDDADIVVYGHSHKYEEKYMDGKLFLNPGSCGPRRFTQPITLAVLEVEERACVGFGTFWHVHKIEIAQKPPGALENGGKESERLPKNTKQIVMSVMKDTDKGKNVEEIAKRNGISKELAEQICRLYLTHPGVDADGIMGKMGM